MSPPPEKRCPKKTSRPVIILPARLRVVSRCSVTQSRTVTVQDIEGPSGLSAVSNCDQAIAEGHAEVDSTEGGTIPSVEHLFDEGESKQVACYAGDVVAYLRRLEQRRQLSRNFLREEDAPVTPTMRAVLIDWLIEVQHYLALRQETLYLTVQIVDHVFDSHQSPVSMSILQLVVISALFVACKMEERFAPEVKKLLHLTDDAYNVDELKRMEVRVFKTIGFNACFATPTQFVSLYLRAADADQTNFRHLCYYLLDVILHDFSMARIVPSLKAAAATYLACKILLRSDWEWNRIVQYHSGYTEEDLQPIVALMIQTLVNVSTSEYQGARKKYTSVSRYNAISSRHKLRPEALKSLALTWTQKPSTPEPD